MDALLAIAAVVVCGIVLLIWLLTSGPVDCEHDFRSTDNWGHQFFIDLKNQKDQAYKDKWEAFKNKQW